jgi:arginine exporter protein ArgO
MSLLYAAVSGVFLGASLKIETGAPNASILRQGLAAVSCFRAVTAQCVCERYVDRGRSFRARHARFLVTNADCVVMVAGAIFLAG